MENTSWEQRPDEPTQAYELARIYFDLGPKRSLRAVAKQSRKSISTVTKWSARYEWTVRARAYDAYRLRLEDAARKRVLAEAAQTEAQKWGERLRLEREEEWQTAQALLAKAREMLASPLEDNKWNWRDAGVMIEQAAKLVRIAAGDEQDNEDDAGSKGLTVRVQYVDEAAGSSEEVQDDAQAE
jgi:hypothetical protein